MGDKKIFFDASTPNMLEIEGKKYILDTITRKKIDKVEHMDKAVFRELDEKQYNKDIELIIKTLSEKTNVEEMLRNILIHTDYKHIRRVAKRIQLKKPIKKQKGCLGFKIGDTYLELLD